MAKASAARTRASWPNGGIHRVSSTVAIEVSGPLCDLNAQQLRLGFTADDGARQHSVMLTARPPFDVSLYLSDISCPVRFIAAMQLSSGMKCCPLPRAASDAAV